MPISDLFPAAGITFWDVAHETNGGLICDGYTRSTGKMAMVIAQNGPGITNLVTPIKTAYWILYADVAGDAASGQPHDRPRRLPGSGTDGAVPRHNPLLEFHRAAMGHDLFHILGGIKEMKKCGRIKLLSFDDVM